MPSQHTAGWGSTTSTSSITASPYGWSTNDRSSSLVKNEDDGVIHSFRSDDCSYNKEDG